MSLDAAVRLAAQLEDARASARRLFGDDYEAKVEPWRSFVRRAAASWGCGPLSVAPRLLREGSMPETPLLLLAATVDVAEEVGVV